MMRVVLLFVILFAGWLLMSGHYTPLIMSFGVISCALCAWLSWRIGASDLEARIYLPAYQLIWFGCCAKSLCQTLPQQKSFCLAV